MNKKFILAILLIFFLNSCSQTMKTNFLLQNIKNDYNTFKILDKKNEAIDIFFNNAMSENKRKVEAWKQYLDKNNLLAKKIIADLEFKKISKLENYTLTIFDIKDIDLLKKMNNNELKINEIDTLNSKINQYQKYLISCIPKDTSEYFNKKYNSFYNNNLTNCTSLISDKLTSLELFCLLTKIQLNIQISQYFLNNYLSEQIDCACFKFYKLSAFEVPISKTIRLGKTYNSEIFFASYDTTKQSTIVLNSDTFDIKDGIFKYKTKASKDTGIVKQKLQYLFDSPADGSFVNYPFEIEYKVEK